MKARLLRYIEHIYPGQAERISLRGAYIPLFSENDIRGSSICSKNWALIGDAASFVDPISGEGICYALYSADILAKCLRENNLPSYQGLCMEHFGENLLEASQDFDYFYRAEFIETMIALAERSKPLQSILSELVAGDRGFDSKANQIYFEKENIFNAVAPRNPQELQHRLEEERFRQSQNRRSQTEARISILSHCFCGDPMRQKGFEHREIHMGLSVLSHNLWVLARLKLAQQVQLKQAA